MTIPPLVGVARRSLAGRRSREEDGGPTGSAQDDEPLVVFEPAVEGASDGVESDDETVTER
jgi:hypothetical protein